MPVPGDMTCPVMVCVSGPATSGSRAPTSGIADPVKPEHDT
jgi:hypothetical protein